MTTTAMEAQGVVIALADDASSPVAYSAITQVVDFSGPGGAAAVIDKTALDSTAKEKIMGLPDEGDFSFTIIYDADNTQHAALRAARAARSLVGLRVTYTDTTPTADTFTGYVTEFAISGAVDDIIRANVTIVIDGAVATA